MLLECVPAYFFQKVPNRCLFNQTIVNNYDQIHMREIKKAVALHSHSKFAIACMQIVPFACIV